MIHRVGGYAYLSDTGQDGSLWVGYRLSSRRPEESGKPEAEECVESAAHGHGYDGCEDNW